MGVLIEALITTTILLHLGGYGAFKLLFKEVSFLEKIVYPQVLGLLLTPILLMALLLAMPLEAALLPLILTMGITGIVASKRRQKTQIVGGEMHVAAVLIVLLAFLLFLNAGRDVTDIDDDGAWMSSVATSIKTFGTFPPETPCLSGTTANYPWGPMILLSATSSLSGVSVLNAMNATAPYFLVLILASAYLVGRRLLRTHRAGVIVAVLAAATFMRIPALFSTQFYALPLVLIHLSLLHSYTQSKRVEKLVGAGLVAATAIYIHALTFVFLSVVMFSYVLYTLVVRREAPKSLAVLVPTYLLAMPYFLSLSSTDTQPFLFQPLAMLIEFPYVEAYGPLLLFAALAIWHRHREFDYTIAALVSLFVVTNAFVMVWSPNMTRLMEIAVLYLIILSTAFAAKNRLAEGVLLASTILFFAAHGAWLVDPATTADFPHEADEIKLMADWAKQNLEKNATLLVSPDQATDSALYGALTERRTVLCYQNGLFSFFVNPTDRMKDVVQMYTVPTEVLYGKYGVDAVVVCTKEKRFFERYGIKPYDFAASSAFSPVYTRNECNVYSVDPTKLEKDASMTTNFTLHSRWYQGV